MTEEDLTPLEQAARLAHGRVENGYFLRCLQEQADKRRQVFVARDAEEAVTGYAMLNFRPLYPPFRSAGIPEIQDLSVIPAARRQGIGETLIRACEQAAMIAGAQDIGIGVGLPASFGVAQRLYVRCGYIPDGAGACYDNQTLREGEIKPFGELMTLKLVKAL